MGNISGLTIRSFREGDRQALLDLSTRLSEGVAPWIDANSMASVARAWVEGSIAAIGQEATVLVATDNDARCLGFASVACKTHFTGVRQAYIGELAVAQEVEGRGIGRVLVEAAEQWASERSCRYVTLETGVGNQPARSFYGRLGFLEESVTLTKVLDQTGLHVHCPM
jgi:GNAT superfamily N-acetyltransferase